MLSISPVTNQNKDQVLTLSIAKNQEGFIETTKQCLYEAEQLSLWKPVAIYDNEVIIGFAMYGFWKLEGINGRVWLDRFLIDKKYQGMGHGKEALSLLIRHIRNQYKMDELYLSLYKENIAAAALYKDFGFCFNGEEDENGEKIMVLQFKAGNS